MVICGGCRQSVSEVCGDDMCRACHVSLSFEDCIDGTWNVEQLRGRHPDAELRRLYPQASQWKAAST